MIQLANVAKGYGKSNFSALKDINLTIEKGEMIAIMGPSSFRGNQPYLTLLA